MTENGLTLEQPGELMALGVSIYDATKQRERRKAKVVLFV